MYINLNPGDVGIDVTFDQLIALAARHGFQGIEMPGPPTITAADCPAVADKMKAAGLRFGAFALPVEFRAEPAQFQQDLAALPDCAAVAQALGCTRTYTYIVPGHNQLDRAANFDHHVKSLRPTAAVLADHGVRLALEFIGPKTLRDLFKHPFIHTMTDMLELCDAVRPDAAPADSVGVLLDAYHWWTSAATEDDLLTNLNNDNIVYVHVNDGVAGRTRDQQMDLERTLPCATGLIDAATFVRALKTLNYDGPVTAEPFDDSLAALTPDQTAERTIAAIRKMLDR